MTEIRSPFSPTFERKDAGKLADFLKVIADPHRLRIIHLLHLHGPMTGVEVIAALGDLAQPTVTHHLRMLDENGLTHRKKQGALVYRRLNPDVLSGLASILKPPREAS